MDFDNAAWQDAQIQSEWDGILKALPVCHRCGKLIESPKLVYIKEHDEHYCLSCIEAMTEWNEDAEVLE